MHCRPQPMRAAPRTQRGVALITALIFLIIITMLSLSNMRSSTLELRMANNDEVRVAAFQKAQAVVDATFDDTANTPVIGAVGYTNCTSSVSGCDAYTITLPGSLFSTELASGDVTVVVERITDEQPPPRGIESSAAWFSTTTFAIRGRYDRAEENLGAAGIEQGVMILIPKT